MIDTAVPGLVRLLGRYEIEGPGGRVIGCGERAAWGLLGLLAECGDSGLARSSAYARMWPDADPRENRELFWRPMREVRTKLCEALGRPGRSGAAMVQNLGASTYRLNPGLFTCDVWKLRRGLSAARCLNGAERSEALEQAIDLYSGPYMPGSPFEFAQNASAALDREVARAMVQMAALQDDAERALLYLERASVIGAVDEYLYRRRMQLHADLGQVHAVRCCYDELIERLRQLDAEPERRTKNLLRSLVG
ncbi:bacterial transcriptional activator domain-containing protein [Actinomadura sp. B10D3]|uniref:AfsR/SARP family transcriptional regulator n=1 Tax=Actinomadura sp. B10D3 TaxID=3153557 RepID=UPI00325F42D1